MAPDPALPDLYPLGARLFEGGFRLLGLDVASVGHHHIPASGPAVVASNHVGYLDFAFVALAPPRPRRRVRFVARREVFTHPVAGPLMRALRQVEADPYGDRHHALQQALDLLAQGEVVGIHPEGTISPSFHPRAGKTGAVRMAASAGVPIVPAAVWGSHRLLTKWRPRNLQRGVAVRVHYGEPYVPAGDDPTLETAELMARIARLLRCAWDTYPQSPRDDDDRWWLPAERGGTAPTPAEAEERLRQQHERRRRRRQAELAGADDEERSRPGTAGVLPRRPDATRSEERTREAG